MTDSICTHIMTTAGYCQTDVVTGFCAAKLLNDVVWIITTVTCSNPGAPVAQWVKRWSTELAVPGSSPAWDGELFNRKRGSIAHSLSLSYGRRPKAIKS